MGPIWPFWNPKSSLACRRGKHIGKIVNPFGQHRFSLHPKCGFSYFWLPPPSSSSHTPHPARTVTMVGYLRCFLSIYAVVLAACMPQLVTSQQHDDQFSLRRLDVMIGNSDEYNHLRNHDPFVQSLCGIPFLPRMTIPQTLEPTSEPRSQFDDGTFHTNKPNKRHALDNIFCLIKKSKVKTST